ncbi:uncharacterized protein LOC143025437 [Oratosquilla oratoria]|uniref:uncharacterized protein LOC143025437 n=1 Tax=Oratosquilla oratoria TaxID=337810 RepID=UPI003F774B32
MASSITSRVILRAVAVICFVVVVLKPPVVLALKEHNDTEIDLPSPVAYRSGSDHPEVDDETDDQFNGHIFVIEHIFGRGDQQPEARWRRNYYIMSFDSIRLRMEQEERYLNLGNDINNIKMVLNHDQGTLTQGDEMEGIQHQEEKGVDNEENVNITETTPSSFFDPSTTLSLLPDVTAVTLPVEALARKPSDLRKLLEGGEEQEDEEEEEEEESPRTSRDSVDGEEPVGGEEPGSAGDEVETTILPTVAPLATHTLEQEPKEEEEGEEEEEEEEEEEQGPPYAEELSPRTTTTTTETTLLDNDTTSSSDGDKAEELVTLPNAGLPNASWPRKNRRREEFVLEEVTTTEGNSVRLVCRVKGAFRPVIEWKRGANLTFPDGEVRVGGDEVHLSYARPEDQGTYMCTARRPHGAARTRGILLRVQYAPRVRVWARDTVSGDGGVEMGCLVEGWPMPSVAWYANSSRLHIQESTTDEQPFDIDEWKMSDRFRRSVLTLNNVTSANFATYHCRAHNSQGVARGHIVLHDGSGYLNMSRILASLKIGKIDEVEWQNSRLAAFLLSMVPPLYIALYIIAYLSCYKTSISGSSSHGRFGTTGVTD